jgi:hypothetical protein
VSNRKLALRSNDASHPGAVSVDQVVQAAPKLVLGIAQPVRTQEARLCLG